MKNKLEKELNKLIKSHCSSDYEIDSSRMFIDYQENKVTFYFEKKPIKKVPLRLGEFEVEIYPKNIAIGYSEYIIEVNNLLILSVEWISWHRSLINSLKDITNTNTDRVDCYLGLHPTCFSRIAEIGDIANIEGVTINQVEAVTKVLNNFI